MHSKQLTRFLAAAASAAAVLGGGAFALASGSAASADATGTTFYACIVTHANHSQFPWHSLRYTAQLANTSGEPVRQFG